MRDVLLGALSYFVALFGLALFGGVFIYLFAPPTTDRARSMAFVGGGGILMFTIVILGICLLIIIGMTRK